LPLYPTLLDLYIDKLEDWINGNGGGINIAGIIIKILLYVHDVDLTTREPCNLEEHLTTSETFCAKVGMEVNICKIEVVLFSLKKRPNHAQISFKK